MNEKLNELMNNETFMNKLAETKGNPAILELLREYGVEMTDAELEQAIASGKEILKEKGILLDDDELSEEGLDLVAGGRFNWRSFVCGTIVAVGSAAYGNGAGAVLGVAIMMSSF